MTKVQLEGYLDAIHDFRQMSGAGAPARGRSTATAPPTNKDDFFAFLRSKGADVSAQKEKEWLQQQQAG